MDDAEHRARLAFVMADSKLAERSRCRRIHVKAVRTIPLGRYAVAALNVLRGRATRTAPDDVVFVNGSGKPLRESTLLRNVLQPAAERAGLGGVTWHQFRYIHSSLLNDLKVPVKIAQEQLEHASISTTLNVYTHVVDASHRKAVEAVEQKLFDDLVPGRGHA